MSKRRALVILVVLVFCRTLLCSGDVLLSANFNNKPVGVAIGTGGASVGEPVRVDPYLTAVVRGTPMPTRSLEITDVDDYYAGSVKFGLVGDAEVSEGTVVVTADLWFPAYEGYKVGVRESDGASYSFANVSFDDSGNVWVSDEADAYGIVGTYPQGRVVPLRLVFYMQAATYNVYVDGVRLVSGINHGITERGIGGVLVGTESDSDLEGTFFIDNLKVETFDSLECVASATQLCLNDARFQVSTTYATSQGASGDGRAVALTGDTGYFWFFGSDNVEVVVKVLDGCGINDYYWVFAAGMTNVEVELTVVDTLSGTVNTYTNPMGTAFQPLQETSAFSTCN